VNEFDAEPGVSQLFCSAFSAIDRTVLTAGAAKADGKMWEPALLKARCGQYDQRKSMIDKLINFRNSAQKFSDRLVEPALFRIARVSARIGQTPTVEDESAAVAGGIIRDSGDMKTKAGDRDQRED